MKKSILVIISSFLFLYAAARQYVYPIGVARISDDVSFIYVMHQQSDRALRLYAWNPHTKIAYPLLHSLFMPVQVSLLPENTSPNNAGFSFVDQGRIRIKKFNKRSPKTIELYEPIYDPGPISWIDEHNGYFCGKKAGTYGIFHLTSQGDLETIHFSHSYDCMYPQKIDSHLFYIQRIKKDNNQTNYRIINTNYPAINYDGEPSFNHGAHQASSDVMTMCAATTIADFGAAPIAFLSMINECAGFCVQYKADVPMNDAAISFVYHAIICINGLWCTHPLFSFEVPTALLFNNEYSLYESIIPLLPRYYNGTVYFSDQLKPYAYNIDLACRQQLVLPSRLPQAHFFAPVCFEGNLFYGGPCTDSENGSVTIQEIDGVLYFDLPMTACL